MNFKKLIPHIVAIATFLILSCVYFSPVFSDYSLNQGDINQFRGMEKEISDFRMMNNDEEPLWTNSMFGGMPAYQISAVYPNNLVSYINIIFKLGLPAPVGLLFAAMLGFYIFALCLKVNPWIGVLGAIAFGFSTINILYIGAGHVTKVNAIVYMAPTLGGLILAFRGKWLLGSAIFALFFALNISSNHLQMTYYLAFLVVVVAVGEGIYLLIKKEWKFLLKVTGALAIGSLFAILPASGSLMATSEYGEFTTRGKTDLTLKAPGDDKAKTISSGLATDYILEYNYGNRELLSILSPSAKGEKGGYIGTEEEVMENVDPQFAQQVGQMNHYWGGQRMSGGAFYFGVIMLVFAIFGLIFLKDRLKWPILVLGILVLLLASNDPDGINNFFINKFPLYNKFRDSKMILVLLQVMIPVLAILFLDKLLKKEGLLGNKKMYLITAGALSFIVILFYAAPSLSGDFITKDEVKMFADASAGDDPQQINFVNGIKNSLYEARVDIYQKDFGRTVLFVILGCGLILISAYTKLSALIWTGIAIVFVTGDNMSVAKRYLNTEGVGETNMSWIDSSNGSIPFLPENADSQILEVEKGSVASFDSKVSEMKSHMVDHRYFQNLNSSLITSIAEFGVLNLNSDYRVLSMSNPFNETSTSFFHKSLGGYHGAKLKNYQELITFALSEEMQKIGQEISNAKNAKLQQYAMELQLPQESAQAVFDTISVKTLNLTSTPVINMLNTRYIILDKNAGAIKNANANGNAWFVENVKKVNSADDEVRGLANFNSKNTAIVNVSKTGFSDFNFKEHYSKKETDVVTMTKYGTNVLEYKSKASTELPAIFSEIYYPKGWNCYVDGNEVKTFKANYVLRGAVIPAGNHTIVWKFEPKSVELGGKLALFGSLVLIISCLLVFGLSFKKQNNEEVLD